MVDFITAQSVTVDQVIKTICLLHTINTILLFYIIKTTLLFITIKTLLPFIIKIIFQHYTA